MGNCIFCKIVEGEVSSYKIYEDEKYLAFLSIDPVSPGHALVVPKEHYRWVWDVPDVGEYFEVVRKVAIAQKKAFGTEFVLSRIVGEEVPHAHIWIYPDSNVLGDRKDLTGNAEKIKKNL